MWASSIRRIIQTRGHMCADPARDANGPYSVVGSLSERDSHLTDNRSPPPSQPMKTENTKGEPTPPAITSFSPARSGTSSLRKYSPMDSPLTFVPSLLERQRTLLL